MQCAEKFGKRKKINENQLFFPFHTFLLILKSLSDNFHIKKRGTGLIAFLAVV